MKQNVRNCSETTRYIKQEQGEIKIIVLNVESFMAKHDIKMTDIYAYMKVIKIYKFLNKIDLKTGFFFQMKSINIYDYFPLQDDDMLSKYIKKDSHYEDRKDQLYTVLLPTVTETKNRFGTAVLNALFSLKYVVSHRWPTVK